MHALEEIRRTLVPDGVLIDLRPLADRWPVVLISDRLHHQIGRLTDLPAGLADDEAANISIQEAAQKGWFQCEIEQTFPFFYYWDGPEEMRAYIQEKWTDFIQLDEDKYSSMQSIWAVAGTDRRICVKMKMLLVCWRKR